MSTELLRAGTRRWPFAGTTFDASAGTTLLACLVIASMTLLSWLPRMSGPIDLRWDGGAYYMLDGYGGVHAPQFASGDIPWVTSPFYTGQPDGSGFDIAKDIEYVQGSDGQVMGFYALDGLGLIYNVGAVADLGQVVTSPGADIYRDLEVSPVYAPISGTP